MLKILYYQCKKCGEKIIPSEVISLRICSCGSLGIDSTTKSSRILGKMDNIHIEWDSLEENIVYKIQHKSSKLFFKPSTHRSKSNFSKSGKIYSTKPSLRWVPSPSEWRIVKFKIEKI